MSRLSRRTVAALAIATVALFPTMGATAEAHTTHAKKASHSHKAHVKKLQARFVLVGTVKDVNETGVTVTVKGGNLKKALRKTDVAVAVTETTKITAEDAPKTLADLAVGDRVAVKGTRARAEGSITYTATRVHVKDAAVSEPVVTPTATAPVTS